MATANHQGNPSPRMVLLKGVAERGVVFDRLRYQGDQAGRWLIERLPP